MSTKQFTTMALQRSKVAVSQSSVIAASLLSNVVDFAREQKKKMGWYLVGESEPARMAQPVEVEKIVEVEVEKIVEVEVEKIVEVEVEKIVEVEVAKIVHVEVEKVVEAALTEHPIFGTLLGEFGPKSVYSTPVSKLITFDIWEKQRSFCAERAGDLANAKRSTLDTVGFPGVITLISHEQQQEQEPRTVCVDGQHRLGAIAKLVQEGCIDLESRMTVEVFSHAAPSSSSSSSSSSSTTFDDLAAQVFTDINLSEPVKFCDLPNAMEDVEREILDEACSMFRNQHKPMFKPTSNCRAPHVHLDSLRDTLFECGIVRAQKFEQPEHLLEWLMQENHLLAKIKKDRWLSMKGRTAEQTVLKNLAKAKKHAFYLGMPGAMGIVLGRGK